MNPSGPLPFPALPPRKVPSRNTWLRRIPPFSAARSLLVTRMHFIRSNIAIPSVMLLDNFSAYLTTNIWNPSIWSCAATAYCGSGCFAEKFGRGWRTSPAPQGETTPDGPERLALLPAASNMSQSMYHTPGAICKNTWVTAPDSLPSWIIGLPLSPAHKFPGQRDPRSGSVTLITILLFLCPEVIITFCISIS